MKDKETNGAEHNGDGEVHEDEKPALKRDGTMQVTAKVLKYLMNPSLQLIIGLYGELNVVFIKKGGS